jgi:hypothetical protein
MGPFPLSPKQNRYLMVVCDYFTKFPILYPMPKVTSQIIVKVMRETFMTYAVPSDVICDNGVQFTSGEFKSHPFYSGLPSVSDHDRACKQGRKDNDSIICPRQSPDVGQLPSTVRICIKDRAARSYWLFLLEFWPSSHSRALWRV